MLKPTKIEETIFETWNPSPHLFTPLKLMLYSVDQRCISSFPGFTMCLEHICVDCGSSICVTCLKNPEKHTRSDNIIKDHVRHDKVIRWQYTMSVSVNLYNLRPGLTWCDEVWLCDGKVTRQRFRHKRNSIRSG